MNCDDARAAYLSGKPAPAHLDHLSSCAACRSHAGDIDSALTVLTGEAVWQDPDAGLEDRVVALISGDSGQRKPRLRRVRILAAAAVAAVLLAGAVVITVSGGEDPDWEVALPGTSNAPEAAGTVQGWSEASGTRLRLDISGLPAAPAGSLYEVWFSREAIHISAGTFASGGEIEMWTGIQRRDYPRIWITLEPIDPDESPSGYTVMDTG